MKPTTEDVLRAASLAFSRPIEQIRLRSRKRDILRPRQVTQYMCYRLETGTVVEIAEKTGISNHATVIHSYKTIATLCAIYNDVASMVTKLEEVLKDWGYDIGDDVEKGRLLKIPKRDFYVKVTPFGPVRITNVNTGESFIATTPSAINLIIGTGLKDSARLYRELGTYKHYVFERYEQPKQDRRHKVRVRNYPRDTGLRI